MFLKSILSIYREIQIQIIYDFSMDMTPLYLDDILPDQGNERCNNKC